uniref:GMC_OxRdtase_N domain-containing protein n=1 Tax=Ascaris lumbricoides TaxID=6252 RepID=A0A0M3HMX4_ASCLU
MPWNVQDVHVLGSGSNCGLEVLIKTGFNPLRCEDRYTSLGQMTGLNPAVVVRLPLLMSQSGAVKEEKDPEMNQLPES